MWAWRYHLSLTSSHLINIYDKFLLSFQLLNLVLIVVILEPKFCWVCGSFQQVNAQARPCHNVITKVCEVTVIYYAYYAIMLNVCPIG